MNQLIDFVVRGKIGHLCLGQSKESVLDILGEPKVWAGKPPCFGPVNEAYKQSDVWHFYDGIVAARFCRNGIITQLTLNVDQIKGDPEILANWPQMSGITMGKWRFILEEHGLDFVESTDELNYWILSGSTCLASCWPYPDGKRVPRLERPVVMINKVSDPKMLADLVEQK